MPTNCSPLTRQIKEKNLQIACFQISALPPMIIPIAYSMYGCTKFRFDIFWCVCVSLLRIVADSIKSFFSPPQKNCLRQPFSLTRHFTERINSAQPLCKKRERNGWKKGEGKGKGKGKSVADV